MTSTTEVDGLRRLVDEQLAKLEEYAAEMRSMAAERDELLAALQSVEWVKFNDMSDARRCPSCREYEDSGHYPRCELAAAIAKAKA